MYSRLNVDNFDSNEIKYNPISPKKENVFIKIKKEDNQIEEMKNISNNENHLKFIKSNELEMKGYSENFINLKTQEAIGRPMYSKNAKNERPDVLKKQMNEFKKYLEVKEIKLKKLRNDMKKKITPNTYYNAANCFVNSSYSNQNKIKVNSNNQNDNVIKNYNEINNKTIMSPKINPNRINERDERERDIEKINTSAIAELQEDKKIINYSSTIDTSSIKKENEKNYSSINNQKNNTIQYDLNTSNEKNSSQITCMNKNNNFSHNKLKRKERENSHAQKKPEFTNFTKLKSSLIGSLNKEAINNREISENKNENFKYNNLIVNENSNNPKKKITVNNSNSYITCKKRPGKTSKQNQLNVITNNPLTQMNKLQFEGYIKSPISKQNKINLNSEMHFLNNQNSNLNHLNINTTKKKLNVTSTVKEGNAGNILINKNSENSNLININHKTKEEELDSDFVDFEEERQLELTNEEKALYGNREPKEYKKIRILGKGGCGIVWLCKKNENEFYALKQIPKKIKGSPEGQISVNSMIAKKEKDLLAYLQANREQFICPETDYVENDNLIKLIDTIEDNNDIWIVFEKAGKSLNSLMFKIKGEFLGNERIYLIQKGRFLAHLFSDLSNFKDFMRIILKFLDLLNNKFSIIHSDLKPDNILIDYEYDETLKRIIYKSFKIIDFGSAFHIDNPDNFASNTPEYMSPEITDLIEKNVSNKEAVNFLKNLKTNPSCVDIWSFGVLILEMLVSCPLWMNYKAKIKLRGKVIYKTGIFGVKGREGGKIYSKQIELANNLPRLLSNTIIEDDVEKSKLIDLLSKMLEVNFKTRISPKEALNHPFFEE